MIVEVQSEAGYPQKVVGLRSAKQCYPVENVHLTNLWTPGFKNLYRGIWFITFEHILTKISVGSADSASQLNPHIDKLSY